MKRLVLSAIAIASAVAAFANVPDLKGMYGWQLEMEFVRLGEGRVGRPVILKCDAFRIKDRRDCLANGLFLREQECIAASGDRREIKKQITTLIDQVYSKPPAGPNDWYASVLRCVHEVGPSWAS